MPLADKTALVERDVTHLIFPDDIQTRPSDAKAAGPKGRIGRPVVVPHAENVAEAAKMINAAKRPMIIIGHGALEAREDIIALAETPCAPVVTTFKGKGLFPDNHPDAGGVLGRYFETKGQRVMISGDCGFDQYAMVMTTAVKNGMDITHILLHNQELGKISKEKRSGSGRSGRPIWLIRPLPRSQRFAVPTVRR